MFATRADSAVLQPPTTDALLRRFQSLLVLLVSAYSCSVGTLLVVFVPQRCTSYVGGLFNATAVEVASECSFQENVWVNISPYNAGVLVVSFLTVFALYYGFSVEAQRDAWIVRHFNADHGKPDDLLRQELNPELHPENAGLRQKLSDLNTHYYRVFAGIAVLWSINVLLSSIVCFFYYYQDYRTATTFIMSLILVGQRLSASVALSRDCLQDCKAESVNLQEAVAFNVVLPHRHEPPEHATRNPLQWPRAAAAVTSVLQARTTP